MGRDSSGGAPSYDVFVSYRRADYLAAKALVVLLESFNQRVFWDGLLRPGQDWDQTLRGAAATVRSLLVLWSRNAAASTYMAEEVQMVPSSCKIIPVMLDGSALPDALAKYHATSGLQVHERLISRLSELTRGGHSHGEAVEMVLAELKRDGIDLTQQQHRALLGFVRALRLSLLWALLQAVWQRGRLELWLKPVFGGTALVAAGFGVGFFTRPTPGPIVPEPQCDELTAVQEAAQQCRLTLLSREQSGQLTRAELASCQQELADLERRAEQRERTDRSRCTETLRDVQSRLKTVNDQLLTAQRDRERASDSLRAVGERMSSLKETVGALTSEGTRLQTALNECRAARRTTTGRQDAGVAASDSSKLDAPTVMQLLKAQPELVLRPRPDAAVEASNEAPGPD